MNLLFKNKTTSVALLLCSALLFSISLTSGAPPFIQESLSEGYEIKVPELGIIPANETFILAIHVFNVSDGVPIADTSVNCWTHWYNNSGYHIVEVQMPHDTTNVVNEWEVPILWGNFSKIGSYSYVVQCNSSIYGGHRVVDIEVTSTGQSDLNFYLIILLISAGIILLGVILSDASITLLGAFGLTFVGIYTLRFGIDGIRNLTYSYAISLILIFLGAYIAIRSAMELTRGGDS